MARWAAMQVNGGTLNGIRVLTPASLRLMQSPPLGSAYAMGWTRTTIAGRTALFYDGVLSTGYAEALLFPDDRSGLVILTNVNSVPHALFAYPRLRNTLLSTLASTPSAGNDMSVRRFGAAALAVTLALAALGLLDLRRTGKWLGWARHASGWKVTLATGVRFVPLLLFLMLPQVVMMPRGRVFSFSATILAMLDTRFRLRSRAFCSRAAQR